MVSSKLLTGRQFVLCGTERRKATLNKLNYTPNRVLVGCYTAVLDVEAGAADCIVATHPRRDDGL